MRRSPIRPTLLGDERGQDLIEYAVIATFVALLAIVGASALSSAVGTLYNTTSRAVTKGANFSTNGSATALNCAPQTARAADDARPATAAPTVTSPTPTPTDDAHRPACK